VFKSLPKHAFGESGGRGIRPPFFVNTKSDERLVFTPERAFEPEP
jgi:hypothetical protein